MRCESKMRKSIEILRAQGPSLVLSGSKRRTPNIEHRTPNIEPGTCANWTFDVGPIRLCSGQAVGRSVFTFTGLYRQPLDIHVQRPVPRSPKDKHVSGRRLLETSLSQERRLKALSNFLISRVLMRPASRSPSLVLLSGSKRRTPNIEHRTSNRELVLIERSMLGPFGCAQDRLLDVRCLLLLRCIASRWTYAFSPAR